MRQSRGRMVKWRVDLPFGLCFDDEQFSDPLLILFRLRDEKT